MNSDDHQNSESPEMLSLMGFSLAKEAGQFQKGIQMCMKAIALNPRNCDHYLHLGRIYLLARKKHLAIKVFNKGISIRKDARILEELRQLGSRKSPPFASLPRDHVINVYAGKFLHALKLR
ncbi:MAG TPA: hypothetical protein HPP94_06595 [Desulfuromonadales bacterium]|nr:hypothetical protein [Desulfuromonadales bacterium]